MIIHLLPFFSILKNNFTKSHSSDQHLPTESQNGALAANGHNAHWKWQREATEKLYPVQEYIQYIHPFQYCILDCRKQHKLPSGCKQMIIPACLYIYLQCIQWQDGCRWQVEHVYFPFIYIRQIQMVTYSYIKIPYFVMMSSTVTKSQNVLPTLQVSWILMLIPVIPVYI